MDRKQFIYGAATFGALLPSKSTLVNIFNSSDEHKQFKIPPYMRFGDAIGITSPASHISLEEIQPALDKFADWGFNPVVGNTIGKQHFTLGGTDSERLQDFQNMLDNPDIKAIMCARGGYGIVRIIDKLNFERFRKNPKWIIGFSDVTVLHSHLNTVLKVASIHAKMCNSFPFDWSLADEIQQSSILSIRDALIGKSIMYTTLANSANRLGIGLGSLVGGNLSILENLAGSVSDLGTNGKILFLEDTGEYLYNIDRMFWNLKRSGKLSKLNGLVVGGFNLKPDDLGEEFGKSIYEIVMEKVAEFSYPVLFDFQVGHQKDNVALNCGMQYRLEVSAIQGSLELLKA